MDSSVCDRIRQPVSRSEEFELLSAVRSPRKDAVNFSRSEGVFKGVSGMCQQEQVRETS